MTAAEEFGPLDPDEDYTDAELAHFAREDAERIERETEELVGSPGGTTWGDLSEVFANLGSAHQTEIIARAIRKDPTLIGGLLFPDLDDPSRLDGTQDVRRELHREAVKEAARLVRASKAPLVYPTDLVYTAEALAQGRLRAPEPTVGGLLYPGRVNALYGTHTAGKTWTALHVARLHAETGGRTLLIDYEDTAEGVAARCMALDPDLPASVSYLAPVGVMTAASLAPAIASRDVTLVILDSTGESMSASGYDSNSEQDVTAWFTDVADGLAALGPAVLLLDHIAKKQDGTPSPVGSFRKSAAITGAQFALENKTGFSRERSGWSKLTCTKDRNGFFATGEVVGRVDFVPSDGRMAVTLTRGDTIRMEVTDRQEQAVLAYVRERMATVHGKVDDDGEEMDGRPNITQIRREVRGDNGKIKEAVDRLVLNGWLVEEHIAQGKSTRDVYVPGSGGLDPIADDA